ncbi:DUF5819 family protein [Streptomyces shenzhenensis]|uniref:DUF5819 family protein n=1 Tax=Streptomyces shenzhenensis TaxID=943815 RepID=UPI00368BD6CC
MDAYDGDSHAPQGPVGSGEAPPQERPRGPGVPAPRGAPRGPGAAPPSSALPALPASAQPSPAPLSAEPARHPSAVTAEAGSEEGSGDGAERDRRAVVVRPRSGQDGPPGGEPAGLGSAGDSTAPPTARRTGVAALSPRYQIGAALALAVVAVVTCVHLGMVFLSVAPANTVTKQHGKAIEEWIYPEFEQNWKLFAPNPLQQNIAVQVRAQIRTADGDIDTTGWYDLSARDGEAIDGSLLPSHTEQNELRRAWDFFVATHDGDNRPVGLRGALSEQYVRRIAVMRLYREDAAGPARAVQRVQVRSRTTNVPPPEWSREQVSDKPVHRVLPWWTVTADEAAGGVR